ncbi:MAG TPA: hypothetical protein HA254_02250 [Candidatus Diapherotrites archaeon]|uniref:Transcriptional regulator n=1 Tax=Candidatus Iainarchaeum sp. TaxID=3101447 RepID=A0A7J4IVA4_9ARCH|nr:hypothetical protein [Candidatus Diapherotrites archaeon]
MPLTFPCEIISWHVLPAVRREIATYLINTKKISRKVVAGKLGLTEAAVCQYLKRKRGGNHQFNDHDLGKIRTMADMLMQSEKGFDKMCVVCREFDASGEILAQNNIQAPANI